jgi:hypothetical protein
MTEDSEVEKAVENALEKVRLARASYEEVLASGTDPGRMKLLKTKLYEAEADLARLKRTKESGPPGHLL